MALLHHNTPVTADLNFSVQFSLKSETQRFGSLSARLALQMSLHGFRIREIPVPRTQKRMKRKNQCPCKKNPLQGTRHDSDPNEMHRPGHLKNVLE